MQCSLRNGHKQVFSESGIEINVNIFLVWLSSRFLNSVDLSGTFLAQANHINTCLRMHCILQHVTSHYLYSCFVQVYIVILSCRTCMLVGGKSLYLSLRTHFFWGVGKSTLGTVIYTLYHGIFRKFLLYLCRKCAQCMFVCVCTFVCVHENMVRERGRSNLRGFLSG